MRRIQPPPLILQRLVFSLAERSLIQFGTLKSQQLLALRPMLRLTNQPVALLTGCFPLPVSLLIRDTSLLEVSERIHHAPLHGRRQ